MIKVEHLSKKFGDLVVLKDITTEIKTGEVVSIIGPYVIGKSTFLRCLNLLSVHGDYVLDRLLFSNHYHNEKFNFFILITIPPTDSARLDMAVHTWMRRFILRKIN